MAEPAVEPEPLKAVKADADSTPDGHLVPLITDNGEVKVTVPPPGKWKTRANRALMHGDLEEWAELVLSPGDYEAWTDADPSIDDCETFFNAWAEVSGEKLGKSPASRRSSRSTARR